MLHAVSQIRRTLKTTPEVIYFDHGLRPESRTEKEFVRKTAETAGFLFSSYFLNVKDYSESKGYSIEEAARHLRYARLDEHTIGKRTSGEVFTAHSADDQAETMVMRLVTGSGRTGFSGIRSRFKLPGGWTVRRPLLRVTAKAVVDYIEANGIEYVVDRSNLDLCFRRNYIRHRVIPGMLRLNPSLPDTVSREAAVLTSEEQFLDECAVKALSDVKVERKKGNIIVEISRIMSYTTWLRRRLIRKLSPVELDYEKVEAVEKLLSKTGATCRVDLGRDWSARKEYGKLIFERPFRGDAPRFSYTLSEDGCTRINDVRREVCVRRVRAAEVSIPPPDRVEYFDAVILENGPLRARSRRNGDAIRPFGLSGSKKIKDLLIDIKLPLEERNRLIIIEGSAGVIWAAPCRRSGYAPVTDTTREALEISINDI